MVEHYKNLIRAFRQWRLDPNERAFIRDSPFTANANVSDRKKIILIQMPMDYFYVASFSLQGQRLARQFGAIRIGLWPYVVFPFRRLAGIPLFGRAIWTCMQGVSHLLQRRKWSKVYAGIGIIGHVGLEQRGYPGKARNERNAQLICASLKSKRQLLDLVLNDVRCGDLIYDTYLRFRRHPTVNLDDPFLEYVIAQCLNAQLRMRQYLATHDVAALLTSYVGGYVSHGIPAREALRSGVAVYAAPNNAKCLRRVEGQYPLDAGNYPEYRREFSLLLDKPGKLAYARRELERRFSGHIDAALLGMKSSPYAENEHRLPAGIDGVVFLHDFMDYPHCYRRMLFDDFWEWTVFTLRVIRERGLKIAVKPHPGQVPENDPFIGKLKDEFPQVTWIDPRVSNGAIFRAGIRCGISVHGTILHELAYHGIAPLAAGDNVHIAFDFVRTASTIAEYEQLLINYKTLSVPDDVQEQVLTFYYMHNLHDDNRIELETPNLGLGELDPDSSGTLIEYLRRIGKSGQAR